MKAGQSTREARFPGGLLVYVYDVKSRSSDPDIATLTPDRLLMPPFFTKPWMWQKGYFRTVAHEELTPSALLDQHCFYSAHHNGYVDENDRRIDTRVEPCGWFSVSSFENLEREIAEALAGRPAVGRHPGSS